MKLLFSEKRFWRIDARLGNNVVIVDDIGFKNYQNYGIMNINEHY
jgi:hypothetical protein